MPSHDTDVRLRHMLDAAREAAQMAQGKTRADLDTDRPLNLSLVRLLEIVGEAASRVPAGERGKYSGIPWRRLSVFATDSSMATTTWILISSGKSSPKICLRLSPNWKRYYLRRRRKKESALTAITAG
jgi:hypothetical protein